MRFVSRFILPVLIFLVVSAAVYLSWPAKKIVSNCGPLELCSSVTESRVWGGGFLYTVDIGDEHNRGNVEYNDIMGGGSESFKLKNSDGTHWFDKSMAIWVSLGAGVAGVIVVPLLRRIFVLAKTVARKNA